MTNFIDFIDTTLRDGQQSPLLFDSKKYRFSLEEKKQILSGLIQLGIRHIELFSPIVNEDEANHVPKLIAYGKLLASDVQFHAHCRCDKNDIEIAMKTGFDGLHLYMDVARFQEKYNVFSDQNAIHQHIIETIHQTKKTYPTTYLRFSTEDFFRTHRQDVCTLLDQIHTHIITFGLPDTVGMATPADVEEAISSLKKRYQNLRLECHFHNDRGLSLINALTAVQAGAEYIDTSIWGLAERSGITSVTGLLLNLFQINTSIKERYTLEYSYPLNVLLGTILNMHVPVSEPVSITNRTHISGVHQKALIQDKKSYEAHTLSNFGVNGNQLLLGPLSGWNLIYYFLREIKYYNISKHQAKEVTKIFKNRVSNLTNKNNPETLLLEIVSQHDIRQFHTAKQDIDYKFENLEISAS